MRKSEEEGGWPSDLTKDLMGLRQINKTGQSPGRHPAVEFEYLPAAFLPRKPNTVDYF